MGSFAYSSVSQRPGVIADGLLDGLASDLLAELIGLIVGIFATYYIVNRVVADRRRKELQPLRLRLRETIGQEFLSIAQAWSLEFDLVTVEDLRSVAEGTLSGHIEHETRRVGQRFDELDASFDRRKELVRLKTEASLESRAMEMVRDIDEISRAVDRMADMTSGDVGFVARLSDLEKHTRYLETFIHGSLESRDDPESQAVAIDGVMTESITVFWFLAGLWDYVDTWDDAG